MEGRVIEYKRELTKDVDGLEREVVSFLNTFGGELIFGLANDGTVYGVPDPDDVQKRIAQRLSENVHPSCLGLFDIEVEAADGGKHLVKVTVSAGSDRPYYIAVWDELEGVLLQSWFFMSSDARANDQGDVRQKGAYDIGHNHSPKPEFEI